MDDQHAFSGLTVVELGAGISAPYATKVLADLGAEVIKVEAPPHGDSARRHGPFPSNVPHSEHSGLFLWLNANKLGITLDTGTPTGRAVLDRLVRQADVLVYADSLPGAGDLDAAALNALQPQLIAVSVTPFGRSVSYAGWKASHAVCCALGGVSEAIGSVGREPLPAPYSQGDLQAGLSAACAIVAALLERQESGQGQEVEVSEVDVLATLLSGYQYVFHAFGTLQTARGEGIYQGRYPPRFFPARDGYMSLSAPQRAQWERFIEVMGSPEWAKDPRYQDRRALAEKYAEEVNALMAPWFMAHAREDIFRACQDRRVPFAPVYAVSEVLRHPHLEHRGFFQDTEYPGAGRVRVPGLPFKMSETPWTLRRPAPRLGQHNEEVLCGRLGLSRQDLVDLARAGVI
ncbi:MAG: CoA transferase [Chloroflexota bacterium]